MRVEFGGKYSRAFEYPAHGADGRGRRRQDRSRRSSGLRIYLRKDIWTSVLWSTWPAGQMQSDFEPVLERQIHYFVNGASGIQHIGQRDIAWISISSEGARPTRASTWNTLARSCMHASTRTSGLSSIRCRLQFTPIPEQVPAELEEAREAFDFRNKRLADLTDNAVEEFYSCTSLPILRAKPCLHRQPRAAGSVRGIQLAGLQGFLQYQPHRPQPAH